MVYINNLALFKGRRLYMKTTFDVSLIIRTYITIFNILSLEAPIINICNLRCLIIESVKFI